MNSSVACLGPKTGDTQQGWAGNLKRDVGAVGCIKGAKMGADQWNFP
jgi:hypothetical protein